MFVAACLLPAFAALGTFEAGTFDASSSLVFGNSGGLVVAANDVSVSRFTYDGHRVTRAETLIGEAVFNVAWHRDAGGLVTNIDYGCGYSVLG